MVFSELKARDFKVGMFDGEEIHKTRLDLINSILKIFLDEDNKKNWVYLGSNNQEFLTFISHAVLLSMSLTKSTSVEKTSVQKLIKLFVARGPSNENQEATAFRTLRDIRGAGALLFENFLAPNKAVEKLIGHFGDLFTFRATLAGRCTLFTDLRPTEPSLEDVISDISDRYGKSVQCHFETRGTFKYRVLKVKVGKLESVVSK